MLRPKDVKLDGASLKGATLEMMFISKSSAEAADFSGAKVNRVWFDSSNLRSATFDRVSGQALHLQYSDFSNGKFTNSQMGPASFAIVVGFASTRLDGASFAGSSLNQTGFVGDNLTTADFTGVIREAKGAAFDDSNMAGMDFSGFDFTRAYFGGKIQAGMNLVPGGAPSFDGTNFSGSKFDSVLFDTTDLSTADFSNASFTHSYFETFGGGSPTARGKLGALAGQAGVEVDGNWTQATMDAINRPLSWGPSPANGDGDQLSASDKGPATSPRPAASDEDKAAALALKTLTAINAQIRAAADDDKSNDGVLSLFKSPGHAASDPEARPADVDPPR
jgi:uncharacterized protein YjbI with pentapeptide repeats